MGRKNKLKKFDELSSMPNVYENKTYIRFDASEHEEPKSEYKGSWHQTVFKNDHKITLELACGKGEYSINLARRNPHRNFIGIDIKGNRLWHGAKISLEEKLDNVVFLRTRIELLTLFFERNEVDEIWITFPDPYLKKSRSNNRLTAPRFLNIYAQILSPGGSLHLKTDDPTLYQYSLETIQYDPDYELLATSDDIYLAQTLIHPDLDIKTYYELQHLEENKSIKYIGFKFRR